MNDIETRLELLEDTKKRHFETLRTLKYEQEQQQKSIDTLKEKVKHLYIMCGVCLGLGLGAWFG